MCTRTHPLTIHNVPTIDWLWIRSATVTPGLRVPIQGISRSIQLAGVSLQLFPFFKCLDGNLIVGKHLLPLGLLTGIYTVLGARTRVFFLREWAAFLRGLEV